MKNTILLFLLFMSVAAFSQPNKSSLDSVTLRANVLTNYSKGVATLRGAVEFPPSSSSNDFGVRDSIWQSYYITNDKQVGVTKHPGQFNFGIGDDVFANAIEGQAKYNTYIGQRAGWKTTTGKNNIYIGWEAGRENTSGSDNVGISEDALRDNTTGFNNTVVGRGAMLSNTRGKYNTAMGYNALQAGLFNEENVSLGHYAGAWLINGNRNVFVGGYAGELNGSDNYTVNESVAVGYLAGFNSHYSNSINIGARTETTGDNQINIGNFIYRIGDDLFVKTSTGMKKVLLENTTTPAAQKSQPTQPIGFKAYTPTGQLLYLIPIYK